MRPRCASSFFFGKILYQTVACLDTASMLIWTEYLYIHVFFDFFSFSRQLNDARAQRTNERMEQRIKETLRIYGIKKTSKVRKAVCYSQCFIVVVLVTKPHIYYNVLNIGDLFLTYSLCLSLNKMWPGLKTEDIWWHKYVFGIVKNLFDK